MSGKRIIEDLEQAVERPETLHYSVIDGVPKGRTDKERLEIIWEAMKRAHLIAERPLTDAERAALEKP